MTWLRTAFSAFVIIGLMVAYELVTFVLVPRQLDADARDAEYRRWMGRR